MLIFYYPNKNPTSPVSDIETHLHTTSLVFCFMFCLNEVLSLAVSKLKNLSTPVYLLHSRHDQINQIKVRLDKKKSRFL